MKKLTLPLLALVAVIVIAGGIFLYQRKHAAPPPPPPAPAATAPAAAPVTPAPAPPPPPPIDCVMPAPAPTVPDGATASHDDMANAHDAIQAFVLKLEAFQTCRDNQADHASELVLPATKQRWQDEGDAAVDQAHGIADAFANQLAIYKAKHPEPAAAPR